MIEQFSQQKPKKIDGEIPIDESKIYQEKIDGGNIVVDVELPTVNIIHARTLSNNIIWNIRTYRYPEIVSEIRQGNVLKDKCTYIGELTCLDKDGIGRLWLFGSRSHLENTFQIRRMSKLIPVVFYPHHIIREGNELLFDLTYEQILQILGRNVKEGNHVRQIPTYNTPQPLLERKGLIEGIVVKDRDGTYHRGKRGYGWIKKKFLQERTVKFISYEIQEVGCKVYTDENKPVHLAGQRSKTATEEIEEHGYCMAEIEFMAETNKGYRDVQNVIIKRIGKIKEQEV